MYTYAIRNAILTNLFSTKNAVPFDSNRSPPHRKFPHPVGRRGVRISSKTTSRKKSCWFPSTGSHRYTQVQPSQESRHFGMDAEMTSLLPLYNDEISCLGTLFLQAPVWSFFGKLELQKTHSQAGAWERATRKLFSAISLGLPKSGCCICSPPAQYC